MVLNGLNTSIIGRAVEAEKISVNAIDIREFTLDKHRKVDDYPYGGGAGMLMQAQPVYDAYKSVIQDEEEGWSIPKITDDAMVLEYATDHEVKMVEADYRNIKITTPEDLAIAQAFLVMQDIEKKEGKNHFKNF